MKGLGHAILTGETLIGNEPFAVILADDLCGNDNGDSSFNSEINLYNGYRCSIVAVEEIALKDTNKYGVIGGNIIEDNVVKVIDMVEKPDL